MAMIQPTGMMSLKVEVEAAAFSRELMAFAKRANIGVGKVIRTGAADFLRLVLAPPPSGRHPVKTGRARAGWYPAAVGLKVPMSLTQGVTEESKTAIGEGIAAGDFQDNTQGSRKDKHVIIVNGVSYIWMLEYGYSQQAPAGMVRISLRKMRGELPDMLSSMFIKEWNKRR